MPESLVYVDLLQATSWVPGRRPQRWYWIARNAGNSRVLARSSERYTNRADCIAAITQLFGSGSNVYLRETEHGNQLLRLTQ